MAKRPASSSRGAPPADRHAATIRQAMQRHTAGDREGALSTLRKVIAADPRHWQAHRLAAYVLHASRDFERALYHAEKAAALAPKSSQAMTMLGLVLVARDEHEKGIASMRRAVEANPADVEAWSTLGVTLDERERYDEAVEAHRRAVNVGRGHPAAAMNLALTLVKVGRGREAVDLLGELALAHPRDERIAGRLAFMMQYDDRATRARINAAHRRWGALVESSTPAMPPRRAEASGEGGRLRVGLLSADFRAHSVSHFARPVLEHLDRSRFEVHALFASTRADDVTERLRDLADAWHDVGTLSEPALAKRIREIGIDVLVELSGYSAGNRLGAVALKPSPAQATWLGYPGTTGLTRVDARLVDATTDPPEVDEAPETERESEKLVRVDPCFVCYAPPAEAPAPAAAAPSAAGEAFTFGSFNDVKKMSPATLDMWAGVLRAAPGPRLLLKCGALAAESVRGRVLAAFTDRGVAGERIVMEGHTPSLAEHLAAYRRVDVALDTFPYHGTTTTCEALWMGVPVVTRAGETHAARVGLSLLTAVGLGELCAEDEGGFVELAAGLAGDAARLARMREGLRERVAASPLVDAPAFARRFGDALQDLWRESAGTPS